MKQVGMEITHLTKKAAKLYQWVGWLLFGICILHFIFWTGVTWQSWIAWGSGALWSNVDPETVHELKLNFEFWALPGSFMIPLLLLSVLIVKAGKQRIKLPSYLGWVLLVWVVFCSLILEPSGFGLGIIPSILLIIASKRVKQSD